MHGGPISPKNDSNMGSNGDLSIKHEPTNGHHQLQHHGGSMDGISSNGKPSNGHPNGNMPASSSSSSSNNPSSSSSSANHSSSSSSSFIPQLAFGNLYIQSNSYILKFMISRV
jgi:hypothetical protein